MTKEQRKRERFAYGSGMVSMMLIITILFAYALYSEDQHLCHEMEYYAEDSREWSSCFDSSNQA